MRTYFLAAAAVACLLGGFGLSNYRQESGRRNAAALGKSPATKDLSWQITTNADRAGRVFVVGGFLLACAFGAGAVRSASRK